MANRSIIEHFGKSALESPADVIQGNKMIESVDIHNFRCFEELRLRNLKTINVIVGPNGSGKTAFLEALYFTLGSAALAFKIKTWRGMSGEVLVTDFKESQSAVWRDIFYNFDQNRTVSIEFKGTPGVSRGVKIVCSGSEGSGAVYDKDGTPRFSPNAPISFEYSQGRKRICISRPTFSAEGVSFDKSPPPAKGYFFVSSQSLSIKEISGHFSTLARKGLEGPVIKAVSEMYPSIESLSLQLNENVPMVHATVKGIAEQVPLGLVSSGIHRVLAYLSAIAASEGGIVIIDEIENGLYYKNMTQVWRVLYRFCENYGVQLFVSTHSGECLKSLEPLMEEKADEFSLLRTTRGKNGGADIDQFKGTQFLAALEEDIDVRDAGY